MMFPKNKRIPRKMFPLLSKGGKTRKNNLFLLRYVSVPGKESRFSFSVSKKVAKDAVQRNRLRRAGYAALEEHLPAIGPNVLASFSFMRKPENNEEIIRNIESILNDSLL